MRRITTLDYDGPDRRATPRRRLGLIARAWALCGEHKVVAGVFTAAVLAGATWVAAQVAVMRPATAGELSVLSQRNEDMHVAEQADRRVIREHLAALREETQTLRESVIVLQTDREWLRRSLEDIQRNVREIRRERQR